MIGLIPARAGSQGLPGKNTLLFNGVSLYRHSVDQAIAAGLDKVIISTDIEEILSANLPHKCETIKRPAALASNTAKMTDVILHFINQRQEFEDASIVLLQPTSPLRKPAHIRQAADLFARSNASMVMSVCQTDSSILKYGVLADNRFTPVSNPDYCFSNRQSLPPVFRPNGAIYVFNSRDFLKSDDFPTWDIRAFEMSEEDSIDIDIKSDLVEYQRVFKLQNEEK